MNTIFHVDVNSAFLSWSALKKLQEDPGSVDLRTVPSAVGGDVHTRHGIITAKSIPAKKYGVQTGEPVVKALAKCPDLILVKSDFATYRMYSSLFMDILRSYTPYVQQASIDEAYMDVSSLVTDSPVVPHVSRSGTASAASSSGNSGNCPDEPEMTERSKKPEKPGMTEKFEKPEMPERSEKPEIPGMPERSENLDKPERSENPGMPKRPEMLAREIADRIRQELGFTVNVGISTNKFLAKMASDFSKPDRIHTLYPEEISQKLWPLPIGELHGCGHATAARLQNIGISTIGDAAAADLTILQTILGIKTGKYIHDRANGIDFSEVDYHEREAKSYSNEMTTSEDIDRQNYQSLAVPILKKLSSKVSSRLKKAGVCGSTVFIMVKTGNFRRFSHQTRIMSSTNDESEIYAAAEKLLSELLFGSDESVTHRQSSKDSGTGGSEEAGLFARGEVLRLIGVGVTSLDDGQNRQMTLNDWMQISKEQEVKTEKNRKLDRMLRQVQNKYGSSVLRRGAGKTEN